MIVRLVAHKQLEALGNFATMVEESVGDSGRVDCRHELVNDLGAYQVECDVRAKKPA